MTNCIMQIKSKQKVVKKGYYAAFFSTFIGTSELKGRQDCDQD